MKAILLGTAALSLFAVSAAFGADLAVAAGSGRAAAIHLDRLLCRRQRRRRLRAKGFHRQRRQLVSPLSGFTSANLDTSGYLLGGQIGCDYQFAPSWVVGIEGAAWGGDIGGKTNVALNYRERYPATTRRLRKPPTSHQFDGAGRLRLGSLAVLRQGRRCLGRRPIQRPRTFGGAPYDLEGSETRLGWTAGVGVEWAVSDDWSVKVEYNYYGFGTRNVTFIDQIMHYPGPEQIKQDIQTIMLGRQFARLRLAMRKRWS